jgi:hypothetical protein
MWDDGNLQRLDRVAAERIGPIRDDPRVVGYYSDNELGWWNAALWKLTLEQPATSGQRQRLMALVHEIYRDDWDALVADFEPREAASWDELALRGSLVLRPGGDGVRTMRRFLALAAERYYQLMRDAIRRHDADALYLGDRYQSFYYPEVARAAGRHVDVASTNLNAHWNDGTFLRSYLATLHRVTGKPILVSEFYAAAMENRSGNRNATSGFPVVTTQAERAATARTTLERLAGLPYVVGAEWFQYFDEPPRGRFDGEDYNFGLVDIEDRSYDQVTAVFAGFAAKAAARVRPRPDASGGVPRAPADPLADFRFMTALKAWDRERGFVPPASDEPLGDLYVCWTPEAFYVGLYAWDAVERDLYDGGAMLESDRAAWTVGLGGAGQVVVRLGGGHKATVSDAGGIQGAIHIESLSGFDHDVRLIAVMRVPASRLGKRQLAPGDQIDLQSKLVTHGQAYEFAWRGEFTLAD